MSHTNKFWRIFINQYMNSGKYLCIHLPTPLYREDVTQGHQGLRTQSSLLFTHSWRENNWIHTLLFCEMQSALSRVWTYVTVSISYDSVAVWDLFPLANQCPHQAIRSHTDQSGAECIDSFSLSRTIFSNLFWKSQQVREHLVSSQDGHLSRPLLQTFHLESLHWRTRCYKLPT